MGTVSPTCEQSVLAPAPTPPPTSSCTGGATQWSVWRGRSSPHEQMNTSQCALQCNIICPSPPSKPEKCTKQQMHIQFYIKIKCYLITTRYIIILLLQSESA